jgi:hypothetical protein
MSLIGTGRKVWVMVLQCQVCRRQITAASWESAFVNPAMLFGWLPFKSAQDLSQRFGWFIWLLAGPLLLVLMPFGGLFLLCWWLLKGGVYLASFGWKCPSCGSRRWAWPRTEPLAFP